MNLHLYRYHNEYGFGLAMLIGLPIVALLSCTTPQLQTASASAQAVLALCSAAPSFASIANPSADTRNRLVAISDKCSAARQVVAGVTALTPAIANLVSQRAVEDQANDIAVVKGTP